HTLIVISTQVEHARRIAVFPELANQAFIGQRDTSCPDWRSCARTAHSSPLPIEVNRQRIRYRRDIRHLPTTIGVLVVDAVSVLPVRTRICPTETSTTTPTILAGRGV